MDLLILGVSFFKHGHLSQPQLRFLKSIDSAFLPKFVFFFFVCHGVEWSAVVGRMGCLVGTGRRQFITSVTCMVELYLLFVHLFTYVCVED